MSGIWVQLVLVAALVVLNAAFAGSEMALVSLREGQLQRLERRSHSGRVLARLARDPNRFLATIQIGITLAGFLAAASAAVALAEPLVEPLGFLGGLAEAGAVALVTLGLTFVTLVFGELAPKRVAMQRAERWGLLAARPLAGLARVTRPVVWLLGRTTDIAVRLMGGDPKLQREEVTEEEIKDMVAAQTSFSPQQRTIISGAFEISGRTLREVLVPRTSVFGLPASLPASEGCRRLLAAGHSRTPVYDPNLDHVVGIVHLRELVGAEGAVGDHARQASYFPETAEVLDVLRILQRDRQQMAVVIDEHGSTAGLVTLEDLIEELVGEIYDEVDPDIAAVQRDGSGSLVVAGSFPIHDLPDIGAALPTGDYATVAGLVLDRLGHIPDAAESVEVDGWRLEVLAVRGQAITQVRLTPVQAPREGTAAARSLNHSAAVGS